MPVLPVSLQSRQRARAKGYMPHPLSNAQVKQVAQIAQRAATRSQEKKRVVNVGDCSTVCSSAYVINPLYNIAQGSGASNRIGSQITIDSVTVKFRFTSNTTTNKEIAIFAFAYWSDITGVSSSTTPTQVTTANVQSTLPLLGNASTPGATLQVFDMFNSTVLREKRFNVPLSLTAVSGDHEWEFKMKFPKGRKITYLSDSASYLEKRNLYVGIITDVAGGADNATATGNIVHSTEVRFRE